MVVLGRTSYHPYGILVDCLAKSLTLAIRFFHSAIVEVEPHTAPREYFPVRH